MLDNDRELLAHYISLGAEPWNRSTEEKWYELEMRRFVEARLPARRPLATCNVGIGAGDWDDWLGDIVGDGGTLVSVDRDATTCRLFALRQARERHAHPSEVVCGDVLAGALGERRFDVITAVGSTLRENGARRGELERALLAALAPGGVLLLAEALPADEPAPAGAEVLSFAGSALALRALRPR